MAPEAETGLIDVCRPSVATGDDLHGGDRKGRLAARQSLQTTP